MQAAEFIPRALEQIDFTDITIADAGDFFVSHLLHGLDFSILGTFFFKTFSIFFKILETLFNFDVTFFFDGLKFAEVFGFKT